MDYNIKSQLSGNMHNYYEYYEYILNYGYILNYEELKKKCGNHHEYIRLRIRVTKKTYK